MNTLELNLHDVLTEDQMRDIAADEFRRAVRAHAAADFERILSNAGYALVNREVDAAFDGKMAETVRTKAIEVIDGISAHTVFRAPSAWEPEPSIAYKHLQAAMQDAKPLVAARVHQIIEAMSEERLRDLIEATLTETIIAKLVKP